MSGSSDKGRPTNDDRSRKYLAQGGPYDGVPLRLFPDKVDTDRGRRYQWTDWALDGGYYELGPEPDRAKVGVAYWKVNR